MKYLFFDTETTGLPKNYNAPSTDVANWPRLVQLAWILYRDGGEQVAAVTQIIRPDGFTIPEAAAKLHGITTERAMAEGVPLLDALANFADAVKAADYLIAHNMAFDEKILGAEFIRARWPEVLPKRPRLCTMQLSTDFCQLPNASGRGYKWPKLEELHRKLFGMGFDGAHDALNDVKATALCFFELQRLEAIRL